MSWPGPERWVALWKAAGATGDPLPWYERLTTAYAEPHRHYHNQQHIGECLREFDLVRHLVRQPEAVEFALWFHDSVYDPKATDNEEQSAALAKRCLLEAGVTAALVEAVDQLVMATKHHEVGQNQDAAIIVDVDLSIFGQEEQRFLQYEAQIEKEYAWVPKNVFASKRAEILENFLSGKQIYSTEWFREKYEQCARRNLEKSISRLKGLLS